MVKQNVTDKLPKHKEAKSNWEIDFDEMGGNWLIHDEVRGEGKNKNFEKREKTIYKFFKKFIRKQLAKAKQQGREEGYKQGIKQGIEKMLLEINNK